MEQVKKFVDETIKSKPVVVFSKTYCPFCVKAKNLLKDDLKVAADKMTIIELEDRSDCSDVQAYLKELTGASSVCIFLWFILSNSSSVVNLIIMSSPPKVPRVFIGGKVVGGCDDTFKAHSNGSLATMLAEALA